VHPQDDSAFRFRTRERKVKTVNFNVGENRPKLIVYHSNVPWTTAKLMHASTTAETLVKIILVVFEIFGEIGRFLPYRLWSYNFA